MHVCESYFLLVVANPTTAFGKASLPLFRFSETIQKGPLHMTHVCYPDFFTSVLDNSEMRGGAV